ncbi:lamin tail domain-containing protein [Curtobacterium sp. RHCJP20]|uniref:Lamin tail domain-containing protein n=1 Tax=Curtobacterium subtropicum TaxID=3055138 RepID=A0ABT7TIJ9_9MICO|nr:lamin tail domain-containing protein [Curtobacterium subtropicum]MDM7889420.1 lamin tail domain-containing protein [Curtobacterium subtropicum]
MRTPALRLGAGLATGIALAAGVLTATPAVAAVGDDDPSVGARVTTGPAAGLAINEVESNADDTDWVELVNTSSAAIDLSGWRFLDSDSSHTAWTLPQGSTIAAGGYLVVDQETTTRPGFDFGLGGADAVRLYDPSGALALRYAWTTHAAVTYGSCPDGSGTLVDTTASTKGRPNDCSSPVRINEVESQDGTPGDWVELTNVGTTTVELGGYVLRDSEDDHAWTIPAGTSVAPGGFTVLDEAQAGAGTGTGSGSGFGFGLGKADSVRLYDPRGTLVDQYSWTAHAATTYGRNPDGTGDFAETAESTKGATNRFAGVVAAEAWPGGPDETVLDAEDTFTGDLSGLDWTTSSTSRDGQLWAVQNGDGLLYHLASDGRGGWAPTNAAGVDLRYADGTGTPDAEGVTVTADDPGAVYVSTERDNDVSKVSRPAVLRFATTDGSESVLRATDEWNLAADFPGLGANAGLEGVTWVPDAWLTSHGFVDQHSGAVYAPASYPGHGHGLFLVGVEGTASVYAYALMDDGSSQRVATIATPFSLVAEVQFDPMLDALWVVCDEACSGRTALFDVQDGAFTLASLYEAPANADRTLANEGFAISGRCVDGARATYYADDNDTNGSSLRTGTYPCDATTEPGDGDGETPGPGDGDGGSTPTPTPTPGTGGGAGGGTPAPTAPAPTTPATPTAPVAPDASALTDGNRGSVSAPSGIRAGTSVTIAVGTQHAGERVAVWLFSEPRLLGTPVVAADGTVTVVVPADVPAGQHRIVVAALDGTLIGWTDVRVDPVTGPLAFTGAELGGGIAAALLLLAAGTGVLVARRRRTVGSPA